MISDRFKNVVLKELKLKEYELTDAMHANEVPGWDSLTHARIIAAFEQHYKIRLKNLEVLNCENLGDLQRLIDSKL